MWRCHYCRTGFDAETLDRNRLCPQCGSDIHCCLNCTHHDESLTTKCREPESPWIADRAANNQCPFFELAERRGEMPPVGDDAEAAKKAFRALFRTP